MIKSRPCLSSGHWKWRIFMKALVLILSSLALMSVGTAQAQSSFVALENIKAAAESKAQDADDALIVLKQIQKEKTSLAVRKTMTEVANNFHGLDGEVLEAVLAQFTSLTGCDFTSDLDNSHLTAYADSLKAADQVVVVKKDEFKLIDGLFGICK